MLEHNMKLGPVTFIIGECHVTFRQAIVWQCEMSGEWLIAEHGENFPRMTIDQDAKITKLSSKIWRIS